MGGETQWYVILIDRGGRGRQGVRGGKVNMEASGEAEGMLVWRVTGEDDKQLR